MIIPAAMAQGHFFNFKRPMYLNFGSLGTIIGHELTHGFDNNGRHFDENGKYPVHISTRDQHGKHVPANNTLTCLVVNITFCIVIYD